MNSSGPPVPNSYELKRILDLPRRVLDLSSELLDAVNEQVCLPSGTMRLWPIQATALVEAAEMDGLFAPIGVGHGKTLITLLLPLAMGSEATVLLVPAQLKKQLAVEMPKYAEHFRIPMDKITVKSYSDLSSAKGATCLEDLRPDLIVADEAHKLRRPKSARTKRFLRYMRENPGCRFCGLSGTMTTRSLVDYAHLVELALRKGSPVPKGYYNVKDWAGAIDVNPEEPRAPGALKKLCNEGEAVRSGFRRRLVDSKGVVATEEGALGTSLVLNEVKIKPSKKIQNYLRTLSKEWRIDEEEIESAVHYHRVQSQLDNGFYYRWEWPDGEDLEWKEARSEWARACRQWLATKSRSGLDSPFLLTCAIRRGEIDTYTTQCWEAWHAVKDRPGPDTVAQWVCDKVIKYADKWAKKPGIVWYTHRAVGEKLKDYMRVYDADEDVTGAEEPSIACSIRAHGTGKNLQRYDRNLLLTVPPNGTTLEQLLGRTHRPGQKSDEVWVDWVSHTRYGRYAFDKAYADAQYMEETTGQKQKVLYAKKVE